MQTKVPIYVINVTWVMEFLTSNWWILSFQSQFSISKTYCDNSAECGSWKHKHTRLFGFHPHCSTLLIHQANIKAAHQKLFSLLSSLFLRDLAEGEREKRGKILVYLKASLLLMALRGDLGHSKFGENYFTACNTFLFFCCWWRGLLCT